MDTRSERTKNALRGALYECLRDKPLNEIQVVDVCRVSGIKRTTFYYHYNSIQELVDELGHEQLNMLSDLLRNTDKSGEELLNTILDSVDMAKELYHVKDGGMISDRFRADVLNTTKEYGLSQWLSYIPDVDRIEAEMAYDAIIAGALQIAISADCSLGHEILIKTIMDLVQSYFKAHM